MGRKAWDSETLERIKRMWIDEDRSASEIAAVFGVSRCAVIGVLNRSGVKKLSLAPPRQPVARPVKPKTKTRERYVEPIVQPIVAPALSAPEVDEVTIPVSERVKLVDLRANHCRFPIGDPRSDEDFGFCGQPKESVVHAYCREHAAICYAGKGRALTDSERRLIAAAKRVTYA